MPLAPDAPATRPPASPGATVPSGGRQQPASPAGSAEGPEKPASDFADPWHVASNQRLTRELASQIKGGELLNPWELPSRREYDVEPCGRERSPAVPRGPSRRSQWRKTHAASAGHRAGPSRRTRGVQ